MLEKPVPDEVSVDEGLVPKVNEDVCVDEIELIAEAPCGSVAVGIDE